MITENLSTLKIHKLTQKQYERELAAGRIDENALYLTPDETGNNGASSWNDLTDKPFEETAEGVKTLEEKFIPNSIARTSDVEEALVEAKNDASNKAVAVLAEAQKYADEAITTRFDNLAPVAFTGLIDDLEVGEDTELLIDGGSIGTDIEIIGDELDGQTLQININDDSQIEGITDSEVKNELANTNRGVTANII